MDAEEKKNENLPSLLPNWLNPKKSGDTRLFMIIAGAIIVALAIFFIGKGLYDGVQAEAARIEAAKIADEQARQTQISSYITNPQTLPKTWGEVEALQNSLQIDNQTMTGLTVSWLKSMQTEKGLVIDAFMKKSAANQDVRPELEKMVAISKEYNQGIKTLPPDVFKEKTTPKKGSVTPELTPYMATADLNISDYLARLNG